VGSTLNRHELHRFRRAPSTPRKWHDAAGVAVNHQRGDVDALEIFPKIGLPRVHGIERAFGRRGDRDIPTRPQRLIAHQIASASL